MGDPPRSQDQSDAWPLATYGLALTAYRSKVQDNHFALPRHGECGFRPKGKRVRLARLVLRTLVLSLVGWERSSDQ